MRVPVRMKPPIPPRRLRLGSREKRIAAMGLLCVAAGFMLANAATNPLPLPASVAAARASEEPRRSAISPAGTAPSSPAAYVPSSGL